MRLARLSTLVSSFCFFITSASHRYLHSFPTRRSSDLGAWAQPDSIWRAGDSSGVRRSIGANGRVDWVRKAGGTSDSVVARDRKSTRLNSSHLGISYAVFCLKTKKTHRAKECESRVDDG